MLDPSFFTAAGGAPPKADRSKTPVETAASKPAVAAKPSPRAPPAPAPVAASAPMAAAPMADDGSVSAPAAELEDLWKNLRGLVGELRFPDRLAFFGALTQLLWLFLPWKETANEGAVLGLASIGAVMLLGAAATAAAVLFRYRKMKPELDPLAPWLVQLGGACFMVFWSLFSVRLMWDGRTVAGIESLEVTVSRPSFGAYVALLSGLVSLAGTLWGLRNKLA